MRDIINNPDALEQSMSSPGTGLKKALEKMPQDEFDAVLEDKQTHPHNTQSTKKTRYFSLNSSRSST